MRTVLGMLVAHPAVHFVATEPGRSGPAAAFVAELGISFLPDDGRASGVE